MPYGNVSIWAVLCGSRRAWIAESRFSEGVRGALYLSNHLSDYLSIGASIDLSMCLFV